MGDVLSTDLLSQTRSPERRTCARVRRRSTGRHRVAKRRGPPHAASGAPGRAATRRGLTHKESERLASSAITGSPPRSERAIIVEIGHTDNQGRRLRSVTDARPPLCPLTRAESSAQLSAGTGLHGSMLQPQSHEGRLEIARVEPRGIGRTLEARSRPSAFAARDQSRVGAGRQSPVIDRRSDSQGELAEEERIVTGPHPGSSSSAASIAARERHLQRGARPGSPRHSRALRSAAADGWRCGSRSGRSRPHREGHEVVPASAAHIRNRANASGGERSVGAHSDRHADARAEQRRGEEPSLHVAGRRVEVQAELD